VCAWAPAAGDVAGAVREPGWVAPPQPAAADSAVTVRSSRRFTARQHGGPCLTDP
jgi:hypothetical protein